MTRTISFNVSQTATDKFVSGYRAIIWAVDLNYVAVIKKIERIIETAEQKNLPKKLVNKLKSLIRPNSSVIKFDQRFQCKRLIKSKFRAEVSKLLLQYTKYRFAICPLQQDFNYMIRDAIYDRHNIKHFDDFLRKKIVPKDQQDLEEALLSTLETYAHLRK